MTVLSTAPVDVPVSEDGEDASTAGKRLGDWKLQHESELPDVILGYLCSSRDTAARGRLFVQDTICLDLAPGCLELNGELAESFDDPW